MVLVLVAMDVVVATVRVTLVVVAMSLVRVVGTAVGGVVVHESVLIVARKIIKVDRCWDLHGRLGVGCPSSYISYRIGHHAKDARFRPIPSCVVSSSDEYHCLLVDEMTSTLHNPLLLSSLWVIDRGASFARMTDTLAFHLVATFIVLSLLVLPLVFMIWYCQFGSFFFKSLVYIFLSFHLISCLLGALPSL